jgi:4-carboxymuconolactone decarboxylase
MNQDSLPKRTPRLAPLAEHEWNQEQAALLAPAAQGKGLGRGVLNIFATLARHPKLYKRWAVFGSHTLLKSSLPPRERELVILRMAWLAQCRYEWGQHLSLGRDAGLGDDEIALIKEGPAAPDWNAADRQLLRAVDELKEHCVVSDETWQALSSRFSETQLMDFIFTAGQYHMLAMALNSFGVELDLRIAEAEAGQL